MLISACSIFTKQTNLNTPKRGIAQNKISLSDRQVNQAFNAAVSGKVDVLNHFYNEGYDLKIKDQHRDTLAFTAARHERINVLEFLHSIGHDLNAPNDTNSTGETVAVEVKRRNKANVLEFLRSKGYDVDTPNKEQLSNSVRSEKSQRKSEKSQRKVVDNHVLRNLRERGVNSSSLQFFHEAGHNLNLSDKSGNGPAHYAAESGSWSSLEKLHELGYRLDLPNIKGDLPVHLAAKKGRIDALNSFHELGYSLTVKNSKGMTPLQIAEKAGKRKAVDELKWLTSNFFGKTGIVINSMFGGCPY